MATISILANTDRMKVGTFSWQDPVHSWKPDPGEFMTVENLFIYYRTNEWLTCHKIKKTMTNIVTNPEKSGFSLTLLTASFGIVLDTSFWYQIYFPLKILIKIQTLNIWYACMKYWAIEIPANSCYHSVGGWHTKSKDIAEMERYTLVQSWSYHHKYFAKQKRKTFSTFFSKSLEKRKGIKRHVNYLKVWSTVLLTTVQLPNAWLRTKVLFTHYHIW